MFITLTEVGNTKVDIKLESILMMRKSTAEDHIQTIAIQPVMSQQTALSTNQSSLQQSYQGNYSIVGSYLTTYGGIGGQNQSSQSTYWQSQQQYQQIGTTFITFSGSDVTLQVKESIETIKKLISDTMFDKRLDDCLK